MPDVVYRNLFARGNAQIEGTTLLQKLLTLTPQVETTLGVHNVTIAGSVISFEHGAGTDPNPTLLTTGHSAGDIVIITNNSANGDVTIVDTGATPGGSTVVLGQNDASIWLFNGTAWVCVSLSDNS